MDQQWHGPAVGTVPDMSRRPARPPGGAGPPGPDAPPVPMRLVIIDDHQMVLDGLKAMLRPYAEQVEIVGECSEPADAVRTVEKQAPDAVLLDVRLRGVERPGPVRADPGRPARVQGGLPHRLRRRAVPLPGTAGRRGRIPAEADPRRRARRLPGPDPRRGGAHRPDPGRPGRAVRRPAAQRGVLARRASRPHPAGERGALAARRRAVQPGDRGQAGGRARRP